MKRGKESKKAQVQISFSMIFSIFLIIAFIAVAIYAIVFFLGIAGCGKTGLFTEDFQTAIDRAWVSDGTETIFPTPDSSLELDRKIKYVCFVDFPKPASGEWEEYYEEAELYGSESNMFYWPMDDICETQKTVIIENININKITEKENPYCIENSKGKPEIKIVKGFYDDLVCIGDNC